MNQLRIAFESTWQRQPNQTEMAGLTENYVREEIYFREALALGLDQGDIVIRKRLRQKMEFFTDRRSDIAAPTEAELQLWLDSHPDAYRREPQLAFDQVFLGKNPSPETISQLFNTFSYGQRVDFASVGERAPLPAHLNPSRPREVDSIFGQGFFGLIQAFPEGVWSGPVPSTFGLHLVRITGSLPGSVPTLDEARQLVARDWAQNRETEANKRIFERLRSRYTVEINGETAPWIARP